MKRFFFLMLVTAVAAGNLFAQADKKKEEEAKAPPAKPKDDISAHQWLNEAPKDMVFPGLRHPGFFSESNKEIVGYCIYLPPGYDDPKNGKREYPVVYVLHGGRPGNEFKLVSLLEYIHPRMESGDIPPMIYVFANGGAMSHYDYPQLNSFGETAFFSELIPQVDANYRSIKKREGRAVEGASQGGRGTARYMFKRPELFISAVPMFGGHQHEKRASENNGAESDTIVFEPGNNTYDLARKYAENPVKPLKILVVVGDADFNYEANLEWMEHLKSLEIPFKKRIVKDATHSSKIIYEKAGADIMAFHARNFRKALGGEW